jgi:sugar (pentulose or hexulose) kinase
MMRASEVIAIIDVGKTNKKLFLFDREYNIVFEQSARFTESVDEDGDPCENLESLKLSVFDTLRSVFGRKEFNVKAINFSAYGASFVYVDDEGNPLTPLYNYLKPYPSQFKKQFYENYGGEENFSQLTASPVLGSLNSGMQLYRLKYEKPAIFQRIKYALHLPQYFSYLVSGQAYSEITSIGCHTNLWDFKKNSYHEWVCQEGIDQKLPPLKGSQTTTKTEFEGNNYLAGIGLHDSSAALIPYMVSFNEPFVLLSTGTWCISLNPFNHSSLTAEELKEDCLCYMNYQGEAVKASRLFAGQEHEDGVKRIADFFHQDPVKYRTMKFNPEIISALQKNGSFEQTEFRNERKFSKEELSSFANDEEAYHALMLNIMKQQVQSTRLVLEPGIKRLFVDGGFSNNGIYMNLLAIAFPELEVYATSAIQATALGAALAIHQSWNKKPVPNTLISLQHYAPLKLEIQ